MLSFLTCSLATQSFVVFCASGRVGTGNNITLKEGPKWESLIKRQINVVNTPLIEPEKSLFTTVAHQAWTVKNFIKALDQNNVGFMQMKSLSWICGVKMEEMVLVGLQIRGLIHNVKFED